MPKDLQYDDKDLDLADLKSEGVEVDDSYSQDNDVNQEKLNNFNVDNVINSVNKNTRSGNKTDVNLNKRNKTSHASESPDSKNDLQGTKSLDNDSDDIISENDDDSKFFVVRVAGGQESMIASMLHTRLISKKIEGIYSVLFLENFKGYVIVEAVDSNIAYEALHGIRHIRGQIRGELPFKDLEGYLIKKPVVTELTVDDTVEIIAGPFKSMKAKITRVDYEKQEATVVLLDSPYQIPVTVDANYLKKSL
ncbi:transcription elongation factor Spt5 [Candidatus Nitrosocosmicus hydrocola]|uniref:transcription elongation factor Spt5 n=1 Tax=Candidatus Nitrosocosmicus hydrocola TaxID=1826872 RepID=UPI0011E5B861|nr:transcription elongation factor Spt5 [Candidatus Nitrosocosmicus hydrocola]